MSGLLKRSIWFSRLILGVGVLLVAQLGLGDMFSPTSVAGNTNTTLGSPDAITALRTQGSVFFAVAAILAYAVASERRLLAGLVFLATIITPVAVVRFIGLIVDGSGAFTLMVLKAEVVMAVVTGFALLLERRRLRTSARNV